MSEQGWDANLWASKLEEARAMGADHGKSAASWYFDGNTTAETYTAVLKGIEDGDPAILDTFPSAPLSGEWAGEPTPRSVLDELGIDDNEPGADDLLEAYEQGFYGMVWDEIERMARYQLEG